jgi:hypothetical protein
MTSPLIPLASNDVFGGDAPVKVTRSGPSITIQAVNRQHGPIASTSGDLKENAKRFNQPTKSRRLIHRN